MTRLITLILLVTLVWASPYPQVPDPTIPELPPPGGDAPPGSSGIVPPPLTPSSGIMPPPFTPTSRYTTTRTTDLPTSRNTTTTSRRSTTSKSSKSSKSKTTYTTAKPTKVICNPDYECTTLEGTFTITEDCPETFYDPIARPTDMGVPRYDGGEKVVTTTVIHTVTVTADCGNVAHDPTDMGVPQNQGAVYGQGAAGYGQGQPTDKGVPGGYSDPGYQHGPEEDCETCHLDDPIFITTTVDGDCFTITYKPTDEPTCITTTTSDRTRTITILPTSRPTTSKRSTTTTSRTTSDLPNSRSKTSYDPPFTPTTYIPPVTDVPILGSFDQSQPPDSDEFPDPQEDDSLVGDLLLPIDGNTGLGALLPSGVTPTAGETRYIAAMM